MMKPGYVSIDLGGTNTAVAVADENLNLLGEDTFPTESHLGPGHVIERMGDAVEDACGKAGVMATGVGIGVPGLADVGKGEVLFLPNLNGEDSGTIGSYVAALTVYSTLSGQSPVGLTTAPYEQFDAKADAGLIEALQETVWEVVSNHPHTGLGGPREPTN